MDSTRGPLGGVGDLLKNGLGELVDRFKQNGRGDVAQSWVNHGPNQDIAPHELRDALGPDALASLSQRTGLTEDELLTRLSQQLPSAIDRYTPEGRLRVSLGAWQATQLRVSPLHGASSTLARGTSLPPFR